MKLVLALWNPQPDALLDADLREALAAAGASRLQVNLDDEDIPETVLRLQAFDEALTCVVSVWTDGRRGRRAVRAAPARRTHGRLGGRGTYAAGPP